MPPDLSAHPDRHIEDAAEKGTLWSGRCEPVDGLAELGQHLRLAQGGRLQPGGHPAEVVKDLMLGSEDRAFGHRLVAVYRGEQTRSLLGGSFPHDLDPETGGEQEDTATLVTETIEPRRYRGGWQRKTSAVTGGHHGIGK
jgi:hypothetical protein